MWWSLLEWILGAMLFIGRLIKDYGFIVLVMALCVFVFWSTQEYTATMKTIKNYSKRIVVTISILAGTIVAVIVLVFILRMAVEALVDWVFPSPDFDQSPKPRGTKYDIGTLIEYIIEHFGGTKE